MSLDKESEPFSHDDMRRVAASAFEKAKEEYKDADPDKPVKVFGISMDPMMARVSKMGYNFVTHYGSQYLAPHTYDLTTRLLGSHLSHGTALKTAAVTTTLANIALKSGGYIWDMVDNVHVARRNRAELAKSIASVLDDIKGKHSIGALSSTTLEQNSLIYTHMKRVRKIDGLAFKNGLIDLVLAAGPNLLLDAKHAHGMWAELKHPDTIDGELTGKAQQIVGFLTNGVTTEITEQIKAQNKRRQDKTLSSHSALEMIQTLSQQYEHSPKARMFQMPGKRASSYGLEEYIMRVVIHHFQELSDASPDHTQVRPALRDELAATVKPIAEAIRSGDLNPLELIHLIGEQKIVRGNGLAIVSPEEIKDTLAAMTGSGMSRLHETPAEHYARASYNRDGLKKTLHGLQGNERRAFTSLVSDEVLEDAGMKRAEIKELHEQTAASNDNDRQVAAVVLGTQDQGSAALTQAGAAHAEIAQIEQAGTKIAREGLKAVRGLRSSASHADGIEHSLVNTIVSQQLGDKDYLSKILARGNSLLERTGQENDHSHRDRLHQERGGTQQLEANAHR